MNEQMNTPQEEFQKALLMRDAELEQKIEKILGVHLQKAPENLEWLYANLHPYCFISRKGEVAAIVNLAAGLHEVAKNQRITLKDQEKKLIVACLDIPGSVYETLKTLQEREISYEEITHSYGPIPGAKRNLEIQKFEFDRKGHEEITKGGGQDSSRDKEDCDCRHEALLSRV